MNDSQTARDIKPPHMLALLLVMLGGMIGSGLRYGFSSAFPRVGGEFPWITLAENVSGAFLLGFAFIVLASAMPVRTNLYLFFCTGILGSFTTFSNMSLEIVSLVREDLTGLALLYGGCSISLGLLAVFLGMLLARSCRLAPQNYKEDS